MSNQNDQIADRLLGPQRQGGSSSPTKPSKRMTTFEGFMRTVNIVLSLLIIAFGIVSYFSSSPMKPQSKDISLIILPFYIGVSGLLLLGVELGIGFLRRGLRFMTGFFGRGVFSIYVSLMCLCVIRTNTDSIEAVFIYVVASLLGVTGLVSILGSLFCCKTHKIKKASVIDEEAL